MSVLMFSCCILGLPIADEVRELREKLDEETSLHHLALLECQYDAHVVSSLQSRRLCPLDLALFAMANAEKKMDTDFRRFTGQRSEGYGEVIMSALNFSHFLQQFSWDGVQTFTDIGSGSAKIPLLVAAVKGIKVGDSLLQLLYIIAIHVHISKSLSRVKLVHFIRLVG